MESRGASHLLLQVGRYRRNPGGAGFLGQSSLSVWMRVTALFSLTSAWRGYAVGDNFRGCKSREESKVNSGL